MSGQKLREKQSKISPAFQSTQPVQNFFLVWIDPNIDESTPYFYNSLAQLRNVVNDVTSFKQLDDAVDSLTDIHEMSGLLIVTDTVGQQILPLIHTNMTSGLKSGIKSKVYIQTFHLYAKHYTWLLSSVIKIPLQ